MASCMGAEPPIWDTNSKRYRYGWDAGRNSMPDNRWQRPNILRINLESPVRTRHITQRQWLVVQDGTGSRKGKVSA